MALKVAQVPCTAYWLYSLPEIYYLFIIHSTFWYAGWVGVGPDNPFNPRNKQPLNTSLCFLGRAGRSAHPWNALALFSNGAHFPQKKNRTFLVSRHCPLRLYFFLWVFHAPNFFAYAVFLCFHRFGSDTDPSELLYAKGQRTKNPQKLCDEFFKKYFLLFARGNLMNS